MGRMLEKGDLATLMIPLGMLLLILLLYALMSQGASFPSAT